MSYTWEQVALGIDVQEETRVKEEERKRIEKRIEDEAADKAKYGLLGSVVGMAFGPIGMLVGKTLGNIYGDVQHKWEDDTIDTGKFYKQETMEFNESVEELAEDKNLADAVNLATSIASTYIQAGGLTAGPDEAVNWTTFGSGEDQWSLFQQGKEGAEGYIPGLFDVGGQPFKPATWEFGMGDLKLGEGLLGLGTAYRQGLTADYAIKQYQDYIKGKQPEEDTN